MSTSSSKLRGSQQQAGWPASNKAVRGALVGLIPLGLLLVAVLVVLALATFAHTLIRTAGFFVEQQVAVSILVAGFLATLIVYIIATVRTLRQVAAWQQDNLAVCARIALWALGSTALVVALPVLLAFFLPQHPAP